MRIFPYLLGLCLVLICLNGNTFAASDTLDLRDFGATGDGITDDGPAFQKALDALGAAGGGTLFVPAGKYVIATPVSKNFTGLASSITIAGVESPAMPAPPTAPGNELCLGLDLTSEIYPRTGQQNAIAISGLRNLVIKDIAFVGTPTVLTDAAITLFLTDIDKAQLTHNEFYGLATLVEGGGIVVAVRTDLEISLSKFLGSTASSGGYIPVVQNLEWRGVTVSDTTFLDYGNRPDFFSKTGIAAPLSWINIGNAARTTNLSPRREVVVRNVFMDEGGFWGLSVLPYRYLPQSAPIDLIYVTGLFMNVSNFNQFGHEIYDARAVFIENSQYGWSQNATAALALRNVGTGILDNLTCVADADHIFADAATGELTVINSSYAQLDSLAQKTITIDTPVEDDPVQYVRARFADALGREPDPAAHFYWSNLLIHCLNDTICTEGAKLALDDYLSTSPAPTFAISGRVTDEKGVPLAEATVTLSGSQSVTATTDNGGNYVFMNLPTSGEYAVTPATAVKDGYVMAPLVQVFNNQSADTTADFRVAMKPPLLLTVPYSNRAVALELTQFVTGPFPLTTTLLSEGRNRTRIMVFGSDLGLLPGENVEAITAEAEDAAQVHYPLRVEFISPLPDLPQVSQIVLRLNGELDDATEVLVTITVHDRTSNKVKIAIQQ
jgi:carboxypeptidase family protein/pectate lyase-like protein